MDTAASSNGPQIEIWAIDRVKPYDNNPRTLPDKATLEGTDKTFDELDSERYAKTGAPDNSAKSYDHAIAELRKQHETANAV
jgi:hypothetical protein